MCGQRLEGTVEQAVQRRQTYKKGRTQGRSCIYLPELSKWAKSPRYHNLKAAGSVCWEQKIFKKDIVKQRIKMLAISYSCHNNPVRQYLMSSCKTWCNEAKGKKDKEIHIISERPWRPFHLKPYRLPHCCKLLFGFWEIGWIVRCCYCDLCGQSNDASA